jgi:uncharacterized protein YjbI with pentapeptide repeats
MYDAIVAQEAQKQKGWAMKISLLFVFCGVTLCAMDDEEKPHPEHQLQLIIRDKNTTTEQFETCIKARPKLAEIIVTGHQITSIPYLGIELDGLHSLDLSKGTLDRSSTLPAILVIAPNLRSCKLANNQIPALSENETHADLPTHYALTELDCSNNQITKADFTGLREQLPNLTQLNLSNCPLDKFNTKDFKATSVVATVDLRNTNLPDSEKKEAVKNAQQVCVSEKVTCISSTLVIGTISAFSFVPLIATIPFSVGGGVFATTVIADVIGSMAFGAGTTYLGFLGFKSPKERFKTAYVPLMDDATFPEKEITTRYARFVKNFPYFCNISKCCTAEDPEYAPLNGVE